MGFWERTWREREEEVRRRFGRTEPPDHVISFSWKEIRIPGACALVFPPVEEIGDPRGAWQRRADWLYLTLGLTQPLDEEQLEREREAGKQYSSYGFELGILTQQRADWPADALYGFVLHITEGLELKWGDRFGFGVFRKAEGTLGVFTITLECWTSSFDLKQAIARMSIRTQISENAARLRALYADIARTFAEQRHGAAHTAACAAFHRAYDGLAFPGGLEHFRRRLRKLDPVAVEEAIEFLEADPWFNCSGYVKEEIVRRLKQAALTDRQRNRLASIVRRSIKVGTRRLSRHLARLAPIVDSPSFRKGVESLADSSDEARRRASHIEDVLRGRQDTA